MTTDNHDALKAFIAAMFNGFRKPNENQDAVAGLLAMFREHLSEFDAATLAIAQRHIIRHRKDPFLPTIAECVEVCEAAKRGPQELTLVRDPVAYAKHRAEVEAGLRRLKAI